MATAAVSAGPPMSDDFNGCAALTDVWTFVDPVGDCAAAVIGAGTGNAQLQFTLPANSEHDAWVTENNVPRVVQTITNTNFTVEIKADSPLTAPFQGVGIMALESPTRFVRCEVHLSAGGPKFFVASIVDGSADVHHFDVGPAVSPFWIRLSRTGNTWTPAYSDDGVNFTTTASFNRTLNVTQVGPYALNAGDGGPAPEFVGLVDYFFETASPIADEDQGQPGDADNALTIDINGDGVVEADPPGPVYSCGEVVTLTAVPGPGGGFAGWTGDIESTDNPLQLTMTSDIALAATFTSDTEPPTITCPPMFIAEAGELPPADFTGGSASDDFDTNLSITFSDVVLPGNGCPEVARIERTWTATDDAGNFNSCVQLIIVEDHTPPVLENLPPNLSAACDDVPAPPVVTATDAGDPAPVVELDEFIVPGDCAGRYTLQRTWTATDACGNVSLATRFITVLDTTPPTIALQPAPQTVPCNAIPEPVPPIVADNCDPDPLVTLNETSSPGDCGTGYIITRTWIASDACGNVRYATQKLHVIDSDNPILTPPSDVTVNCGESTDPEATGVATARDASDPNPLVTYTDAPAGANCSSVSIARTWKATDWAGNSVTGVQMIHVTDTTPPEITGIPKGEVLAECGSAPPPPTPTVTDNCDPAPNVTFTETISSPPGDCGKGFTVLRTWTATDACGNTSTATQTLRFMDKTPPVLTIPPDVTVSCGPAKRGSPTSIVPGPGGPGVATAVDACDPDVMVTYTDIVTPGPAGSPVVAMIKRTWTATDHCGNSVSAVQGVQLIDHTPPAIVQCPPDRTLSAEVLAGHAKRAVEMPDFRNEIVAMDTCSDEITIEQLPPPGTLITLGTHSVHFIVSDSYRNETTCKFTLTLVPTSEDRCPDDPNKTAPGVCGCGVPDIDSDGDGVLDCLDGCPDDPTRTAPGPCGCGVAETDSDGDGVPDCIDGCPSDPAKSSPGACGCGNPETDTDGDGTPDCIDLCPNDPRKTEPGNCGCGVSDADSDDDGVIDCLDGCPNDPNKTEPGACGCGVPDTDANENGVPDCLEVCPTNGDCFTPHDSPGCVSSECCGTICNLDFYCCNVAWDQVCAAQALIVCEAQRGNECQNPLPIDDGSVVETLVNNSGATGDDTDRTEGDCAQVLDTIDEWYIYTASVNGIATATTCSPLTNFDTTLAVFDQCDGTQITCAVHDDQCTFGSTVQWNVHFGETYLIRVSGVDDAVGDYELIVDSEPADVPSEVLDITFWYGQNQVFGHIGQPQRQVNLLGNVHAANGIESLTYRLNGGPEIALNYGPDLRRLYHPGDFNVELFYDDLPEGANQCIVRVLDGEGNVVERSLNFTVEHGNVAPLPYSIDWSTAPDIQSVAQVVDGKWQIEPLGVRIIEQGYDRLVAVGDITWTDYEVTVPITIHSVDPNGYLPPSHTPGLGLILRWEGHTDFLEPGASPMTGYWPLGCAAEYVFHLDQCGFRQQLYGNPFVLRAQDDECDQLEFGVTYLWKVRVDTQPDGSHFYGFKIWEDGTPEPEDWELTMVETPEQPDNGCMLLFSHHVEATFGNVQVVPVP